MLGSTYHNVLCKMVDDKNWTLLRLHVGHAQHECCRQINVADALLSS